MVTMPLGGARTVPVDWAFTTAPTSRDRFAHQPRRTIWIAAADRVHPERPAVYEGPHDVVLDALPHDDEGPT
jgi:hypothetical protein